MATREQNVVVIGGGPAGYTAAIRAAQLGARVSLIEKYKLGGACLNWACIPTNFLLHSVELYHYLKNASRYGITVGPASFDMDSLRSRKEIIVSTLADGLTQLMAANRIKVIRGRARLTSPEEVEVNPEGELKQVIRANNIIIATGSMPVRLKVPGVEATGALSARDILELKCIPQSLVMIGGGAVGVELATILTALGCKVSLIEVLSHILPAEDAEITSLLERALKKDGIRLYTGNIIKHIEQEQDKRRVFITANGYEQILEAEAVAVAIGQKPYFEGLGLEACEVKAGSGGIKVDEHMAASVPGIFAAGDVTGKPMLAYVAMAQGKVAAENAMGLKSSMNYTAVPRCVFSLPELASVGLTEAEAISRGYKVKCGRFPLAANAAATVSGERRGLVKMVAEADSNRILGVHIIGMSATNLIAECTLALKMGATVEDIQQTLHAHPTLSEAVWEAALDVGRQSLNFKSG